MKKRSSTKTSLLTEVSETSIYHPKNSNFSFKDVKLTEELTTSIEEALKAILDTPKKDRPKGITKTLKDTLKAIKVFEESK